MQVGGGDSTAGEPSGVSVGRGTAVLGFSALMVRLASFASQVGLGLLLTARDFGVYALATGFASLATSFRGGGVQLWLVSQGRTGLRQNAALGFRLSLALNTACAFILVLGAKPVAAAYGVSGLALVIVVIAVSFPLNTPAMIYSTQLQVLGRFGTIAKIEVASAALRYGTTVAFAAGGLGALSFVLPLPLVYLFEAVVGYLVVRDRPWRGSPGFTSCLELLRNSRWLIAGSVVGAFAAQADYLTVGALTSVEVVGLYFFAYQLTYQGAGLVAAAMHRVLTPSFAAVRGDAVRTCRAYKRALSATATMGAPPLLLLGLIMDPLERLVWHGRWADSVGAVQALTAGLPFHLLVVVSSAVLVGRGRYRLWAGLVGLKGLVTASAAALGVALAPDSPTVVAIAVSGGLVLSNCIQLLSAARSLGLSTSFLVAAVARPLLCVAAAGTGVYLFILPIRQTPVFEIFLVVTTFGSLYLATLSCFARGEFRAAATILGSLKR